MIVNGKFITQLGTDASVLSLDKATNAINTIDYAHHEIHAGSTFSYCEVTDLGNGAIRDVLIVTPNTTKWAHMVIVVETELETDYLLYEGTTTSNDGTAVTEVNRDRNNATAATVVVTHTPTVTAVGTLICAKHWGSGKGTGGGDRAMNEWILKQNTKYLLRITNATANNNQTNIELLWYEHTNKL